MKSYRSSLFPKNITYKGPYFGGKDHKGPKFMLKFG